MDRSQTTYAHNFQKMQLIFAQSKSPLDLLAALSIHLVSWQSAELVVYAWSNENRQSFEVVDGLSREMISPENYAQLIHSLKLQKPQFSDSLLSELGTPLQKERFLDGLGKWGSTVLVKAMSVVNLPILLQGHIVGVMSLASGSPFTSDFLQTSEYIVQSLEKFFEQYSRSKIQRQKERLFRLASDRFFEGLVVEDAQGHTSLVNQKFCELFSFPHASRYLEDLPLAEILRLVQNSADDEKKVSQWMKTCLELRKPFKGYLFRTKENLWIEGNFLPLSEGQSTISLWSFKDVTQAKIILDQQGKLNALLEEGQKIASFGSWEFEVATQQVIWSKELYEIFGFHEQHAPITYARYLALVHPDDLNALNENVENAIRKGESYVHRHRIITPDGVVRHIEGRGRPHFTHDGQLDRLIGTAQDITESVMMENDLIRSKELALKASEAKSNFLANLSHEIRTPMNGIIGLSEIALAENHIDAVKSSVEMIKTAGEGLLQIINDILDFSKLEAKKAQIHVGEIKFENFFKSTLSSFIGISYRKRIFFSYSFDSSVPSLIWSDENKIRQILMNLIGNAFKFTESGFVHVEVGYDKKKKSIHISVQDTGIGISSDSLTRIFEPFEQGFSTQIKKHGGTGLGLSIVKKLAELLSAELSVESQLGQGSMFKLSIPVKVGSAFTPSPSLKCKKLFFVSDRVEIHRLLAQLLESSTRSEERIVLTTYSSVTHLDYDRLALLTKGDVILIDTVTESASQLNSQMLFHHLRATGAQLFYVGSHGPMAKALNEMGGVAVELPFNLSCLSTYEKETLPKSQIDIKETNHKVSHEGIRILVAEDNPINQTVIRAQLSKLGFESDLVNNGFECLQAVEQNEYDLVLMDCHMPIMDGFQATEAIRRLSDHKKSQIPVVALTALVLDEDIARCYQSGMSAALSKPIQLEELNLVILSQCRSEKLNEVV